LNNFIISSINIFIHFLVFIIFILLFYFDIIYHIFLNFKFHKLSFKKLLFLDDPYKYRIEIIPLSLLAFPILFLIIYFRFIDLNNFNTFNNFYSNLFYTILSLFIFINQYFGVITYTLFSFLKKFLSKSGQLKNNLKFDKRYKIIKI
jgi:hypothetical protein